MKMNRIAVIMLCLSLMMSFVFANFPLNFSPVSASPIATIYIDPTPVTAYVCQNFTVAVIVKDVTDLYAWQFKLSWNPDLLECIGYDFGPFLPPPTFRPLPVINNTAGWILAGDSRMMPPGVSGSGTVFYIKFHCDGSGACDLVFSGPDTFLLDSNMYEIPCVEVNGHVVQKALTLDVELYPRKVVDLGDPTSTQWHELHPVKSNYYHLMSWEPGYVLSPEDQIDMYLIDPPVKIYVETAFVDPLFPWGSEWHETYPTYCQWWKFTSWEDNGDGYLSPCDQIDMTNTATGDVVWFHVQEVIPPDPAPGPKIMYLDVKYWFQVDEVTVDMTLSRVDVPPPVIPIFVEYKCGYWTFDPKNPICTKWNQIDPEMGPVRCLHLTSWYDNENSVLDPGDIIDMTPLYPTPGPIEYYQVKFVSISLKLTPKPSPPVVQPPPSGPVYLESEISYDMFDLSHPVCTYWHEIYPYYSRWWHLSSWENFYGLSPSDQIVLALKDEFGEPIPGTEAEYHVDKLTVAMNLTDMREITHIVKFEESLKEFKMYHWRYPISTQWHEVNPEYCRQWHIMDWLDNGDGYLGYCDLILMIDKHTGLEEVFHVESLSTDMWLTLKVHDVAVTAVSSRYPVVYRGHIDPISVTITNLGDFNEPTVDVYAYYDGNLAAPKQTTSLNIGETKTLTFNWDTTGVPPGVYTISAKAVIPIDDFPGNNYLSDGTQEVKRPPPEILDVELYPREVVDLGDPTGTQWHELHPEKSNLYHLMSWDPDRVLSPDDLVMMDGTIFEVDDVTIDIEVVDLTTHIRYWLDYECGYWTFDPKNPICTKWNEIKNDYGQPEPPRCWHLTDWKDNGDGRLNYCDNITMTPNDPFPGPPVVFHVELVTVTLKLTELEAYPPVQYYLEFMGTLEEFQAWHCIYYPFDTMWHEILPVQGRLWTLTDWANLPFLSPSDQIVLALKDKFGEPIPGTEVEYHVDKLTVAMNITSTEPPIEWHIIKFEGSLQQFKKYHWTMETWPGPLGTQWHEVNPDYCRQWYLFDWFDTNGDNYLGYCDYIQMVDKETGYMEVFHVESLSTDMWLTVKHDVAVTNATNLKTVVCQGYIDPFKVTVENQGYSTETFNVTAYADKDTTIIGDEITIGTKSVTLSSGNSTTITFLWNTTGVTKGNYTKSAYAWPVPGEADLADNRYVDGWIIVSMVGDLTGPAGYPDGKVDMRDVYPVAKGFGAKHITNPNDPRYCQYWHTTPCGSCPHTPNADINADGTIDMKDVYAVAKNFGKTDP